MLRNYSSESPKISELNLELIAEKRKMPKDLNQIKKTKPLQLSLFELLTETDVLTDEGKRELKRGRNYSQTLELIDFMPRFVWGHQKDLRKDYNGLLPVLQRDFESRGTKYRLNLKAATILAGDGKSIAYYPSADEDLLEVVLRKMYLDDPQYFDGLPGMTFTIKQIQDEMKSQGHTRSYQDIKHSLVILSESSIECQNLDTDAQIFFRVISTLYFSKSKSPDAPCYLIFSKPYAEALEGLYFRRVNYKQVVRYKNNFARLLHRRISHHYTQANNKLDYTVYLTTLVRDFGLQYQNLTKARYDLEKALIEMVEAGVIEKFDPEITFSKVIDPRNTRKIEDYFLTIKMSNNFSFDSSNSNTVTNVVKETAQKLRLVGNSDEKPKEITGKRKKRSSDEEKSASFADVLPISLNKKSRKDK